MKIKGLLLSLFVTSSLLSIAQDIKLPSPQKQGGEPLLQVLSKRASTRDFDTQKEYRLTNPFQPIVGGMGIQPRRQAYGAFGHESSRNFTIYRHGTRGLSL